MAKTATKYWKRFQRGALPYCFTRLFNPRSPRLPYYKYIMEHGDSHFMIFPFMQEYLSMKSSVFHDDKCGLPYVLLPSEYDNRRLYFRRDMSDESVWQLYVGLLAEQDARSPHHYFDSLKELQGRQLLDIGSAEGILSLMAIEQVSHVWLFECDSGWVEALEHTFAPWKDKVTIVCKYIGDNNDGNCVTLDSFFSDKPHDNLYLKMDIEGMERKALAGARRLFDEKGHVAFAICSYHLHDDMKVISSFLSDYNCSYIVQKGYYSHRYGGILLRGHN